MAGSTWMFDRGAAALTVAFAESRPVPEGGLYLCPLCLHGFTREELHLLSKEHAPPKSVGGPVVTLTCTDCNHGAGSMQAHAARRSAWQSFAARKDGVSHTVRIRDDQGFTVTADVEYRDGDFYIIVDPKRSNPHHHEALLDHLSDGSAFGAPFTLEGDVGFRTDRAQASDLRDAYIVAFALLGYRFILWPDLDEIRQRIADGGSDSRLFMRTDLFPDDFHGLLTLSQPIECVGVITAGGRCVFLPWPTKAADLTEWLIVGAPLNSDSAGRVHPWPKGMPMLLDLAASALKQPARRHR